jgi:PEGA domain
VRSGLRSFSVSLGATRPTGPGWLAVAALAIGAIGAAGVTGCKGGAQPAGSPAPVTVENAATRDAGPAMPPTNDDASVASGGAAGSAPAVDGVTAEAHGEDDGLAAGRNAAVSVHSHRTLEILLRSQPPGATVAVDGVIVGQTPAYWEGEFVGREREFTFVLPGYTMARYRFVPTSNGVVYGRLLKLASDHAGGVPMIPRPADLGGPGPAPSSGPPPPHGGATGASTGAGPGPSTTPGSGSSSGAPSSGSTAAPGSGSGSTAAPGSGSTAAPGSGSTATSGAAPSSDAGTATGTPSAPVATPPP